MLHIRAFLSIAAALTLTACNSMDDLQDQASSAWDATTDTASSAWDSTTEWVASDDDEINESAASEEESVEIVSLKEECLQYDENAMTKVKDAAQTVSAGLASLVGVPVPLPDTSGRRTNQMRCKQMQQLVLLCDAGNPICEQSLTSMALRDLEYFRDVCKYAEFADREPCQASDQEILSR